MYSPRVSSSSHPISAVCHLRCCCCCCCCSPFLGSSACGPALLLAYVRFNPSVVPDRCWPMRLRPLTAAVAANDDDDDDEEDDSGAAAAAGDMACPSEESNAELLLLEEEGLFLKEEDEEEDDDGGCSWEKDGDA